MAADICADLTASLLHFVNDASANLMMLLENGGGRTKKKVNHRRYLQKQLEQCRSAASTVSSTSAAVAGGAGGQLSPTPALAAGLTADDNSGAMQCDAGNDGGCAGGDCGGQCGAPSKARKASYSRRKARRSHPAAAASSSASWSTTSSPSAPSSLSSTPPQSRRSSLVETIGAAADVAAAAAAAAVAKGGFCQMSTDFRWEPHLSQGGGESCGSSSGSCSSVAEVDRGLADDSLDSLRSLAEATAATAGSSGSPLASHWLDVFDDPIAEFFNSQCAVDARPDVTQLPLALPLGPVGREQQQQLEALPQSRPRSSIAAADLSGVAATACNGSLDATALAIRHPEAEARRYASCAVAAEASSQMVVPTAAPAATQLRAPYAQQQPAFIAPAKSFYTSSPSTAAATATQDLRYPSPAAAAAASSPLFNYASSAARGGQPLWIEEAAASATAAAAATLPHRHTVGGDDSDAVLDEDDLMSLSDLLDRLADEQAASAASMPAQPSPTNSATASADGANRWSSCSYYHYYQQQRYNYSATAIHPSPVAADFFAAQQLQRQILLSSPLSLQQQQHA